MENEEFRAGKPAPIIIAVCKTVCCLFSTLNYFILLFEVKTFDL